METANNPTRHKNQGAVLIISLIFVIVLSTLAVSLASLSGINVQLADNQHKLNRARACTESGLDVTRFWLSCVSIPGTTSPSERCSQIAASLQKYHKHNDNLRRIDHYH
jgi:Tfp pilus assembly protein PilX